MASVVLIDDHPVFAEGMMSLLKRIDGISDIEAFPNTAAFFGASQANQRPDLILLDLYIDGDPCWSDLRELAHNRPKVRVAVVSGSPEPNDVHQAFEHGAIGFVPKSVESDTMERAIGLLLRGETYVPATILNTRPTSGAQLTDRQVQVVELVMRGRTNQEIASELGLAVSTVKVHLGAVMRKLGVKNRTELSSSPALRHLR
ncbi:MAG: response regulator transcription factor [Pseudomonadota bacterium]